MCLPYLCLWVPELRGVWLYIFQGICACRCRTYMSKLGPVFWRGFLPPHLPECLMGPAHSHWRRPSRNHPDTTEEGHAGIGDWVSNFMVGVFRCIIIASKQDFMRQNKFFRAFDDSPVTIFRSYLTHCTQQVFIGYYRFTGIMSNGGSLHLPAFPRTSVGSSLSHRPVHLRLTFDPQRIALIYFVCLSERLPTIGT